MTDPVDTDALKLLGLNLHGVNMTKEGVLVVRAANELDRLRRELKWMSDHATQRAAAYEHARAVIENAPHREKCRPHIACTCWKAEAL